MLTGPWAINVRTKEPYQPGLGPHTETLTVSVAMGDLAAMNPDTYAAHDLGVPYADGSRQKCDLCLGGPPSWVALLQEPLQAKGFLRWALLGSNQ
jgi:hypothetical protein